MFVAQRRMLSCLSRHSAIKLKRGPTQDSVASPVVTEPYVRPRERAAIIQHGIEDHLRRQKERDYHWDDLLDVSMTTVRYVRVDHCAFRILSKLGPVPWNEQLFKALPASGVSSVIDSATRSGRPLRLRVGRGGRLHVDRKASVPQSRYAFEYYLHHKPAFAHRYDGYTRSELDERAWRMADRWKFDSDITTLSNTDGTDDEDRVLFDDFQPKYVV